MAGLITILCFAIVGILTGLNFAIPYALSKYIAVAILAALDSVFGAMSANMKKEFRIKTFLSGFFGNALIAMFLTFIGEKLDVDIYLGVVIVFSGRLLNNFSTIRRGIVSNFDLKKVKETVEGKSFKVKKEK